MNLKPPVEKNEKYIVKIEDLGSEGQGVGKVEGFTVFIPETLPGELCEVLVVKVNKNFAFGKVIKFIEKSEKRVEPLCPVATRCGGCSLQHLDYKEQLNFKTKRVKDVLERLGGFKNINVLPTIGMENPYNYRNKAQMPIDKEKEAVSIGFYAKRSHVIINCESCMIQHKANDEIVSVVRNFIKEFDLTTYNETTNKGLLRHVLIRTGFETGEIMVCIVANGAKIPEHEVLIQRLREIEGMTSIVINTNRVKSNVILGDRTRILWGKDYITDYIGEVKFEISPLSFFQINPIQTKILYSKALEVADIKEDETVLDLYCGIGTISLFMAKVAKKVLGVDIIAEAIQDARKNAEINSIKNAEFMIGSAEELVPMIHEEQFKADIIVVDPPRKGCGQEVLDTIVEMNPKKIVYVSCEPSTLARDLKFLADNGFEVGDVQPVDQFCHSTHVETCVLLSHKNSQTSPPSL